MDTCACVSRYVRLPVLTHIRACARTHTHTLTCTPIHPDASHLVQLFLSQVLVDGQMLDSAFELSRNISLAAGASNVTVEVRSLRLNRSSVYWLGIERQAGVKSCTGTRHIYRQIAESSGSCFRWRGCRIWGQLGEFGQIIGVLFGFPFPVDLLKGHVFSQKNT